jgi:hypothetical protein
MLDAGYIIRITSPFTGWHPETSIQHLFHNGTTWSNKKVLPQKAQNLHSSNYSGLTGRQLNS